MLKYFILKKTFILAASAIIAAIFFVDQSFFNRAVAPPAAPAPPYQDIQGLPIPTVVIGTTKIAVELATSTAAIRRGLSNRAALALNRGMLFIFPKLDRYRFWMPNMHFPIDIIWLNAHNKIVDIHENVSHEFNPAKPLFFMPDLPAQYVLEVNAGFSKNHGIHIGDTAVFYYTE